MKTQAACLLVNGNSQYHHHYHYNHQVGHYYYLLFVLLSVAVVILTMGISLENTDAEATVVARRLGRVCGDGIGGGCGGILGWKITMVTYQLGCWRGFSRVSTRRYMAIDT